MRVQHVDARHGNLENHHRRQGFHSLTHAASELCLRTLTQFAFLLCCLGLLNGLWFSRQLAHLYLAWLASVVLLVSVGVLDASLDDQWQQQKTAQEARLRCEESESMVNLLIASGESWADTAYMQSACAIAVPSPQEVRVEAEIGEHDLDGQRLAWLVISALVNDQCKVVALQHQAEEHEDAALATQQHAGLDQEESTSH